MENMYYILVYKFSYQSTPFIGVTGVSSNAQTPTLFGENTPLLEVSGLHQSVIKITPFHLFFFLYVDVY